jgi:hypothetical protein
MPTDNHEPAKPEESANPEESGRLDASAGPEAIDGDEVEAPMNRAERRAKGKSGGKPAVVGKIQPARANNGPAPRSYANRRSG